MTDPRERDEVPRKPARVEPNETVELTPDLVGGNGSGASGDGPSAEIPPTVSDPGAASSVFPFQKIRHYSIEGIIGRGGMGVVYLARDEHLGRKVAIKSLPDHLAGDERRVESIQDEARHLAALNHPHIGSIYGIEIVDGTPHLVLEFVDGVSLAEKISRGPCALEDSLRLATQIASALEAAHVQGIVHRDLKPSNVMVDATGGAKVLDFGLAVTVSRTPGDVPLAGLSAARGLAGTPRYMSPEQVQGLEVDASTDLWAFGCLLFEMLTGKPAFPIRGLFELDRILEDTPSFDQLPTETPSALVQIIRDCLEKSAKRRPTSMEGLRSRLLELQGSQDLVIERRLVGRWHLLRDRARLGDSIQLRLHLRNHGREAERLQYSVEPLTRGDDDGALRFENPSGVREILPAAAGGVLISARCLATGMVRLPAVRLHSLDDPSRTEVLRPIPTEIRIREADPDLSLPFRTILEPLIEGARAEPNCGSLTLARGGEGSGRSIFCREARRQLERAGFRVLRGYAPVGRRQDRKVFQDLLRDLLGIDESAHTEESLRSFATDRLAEHLGSDSTATPFFVEILLGHHSTALTPESELHRWFHLLSAASREAPLALVIENLSAADPESIGLLAGLLRRFHESEAPVLVVATGDLSPSDLALGGEGLGEAGADDPLAPLELGGLVRTQTLDAIDSVATGELIESIYRGADHTDYYPQLAEELHSRTGGAIGLSVRLIETLGAGGEEEVIFSEKGGGEWRTIPNRSATALLDRHSGTSRSIEQLLSALSPDHQSVLEYASWIGTEIPVVVLERLDIDADRLDEALDAIERAGLIVPTDPELTHYRFTRAQIPEWVRSRTERGGSRAAARRKRRIASALIEEFGEDDGAIEWLGQTLIDLGRSREGIAALLRSLSRYNAQSRYESAHSVLPRIEDALSQVGPESPEQMLHWHIERARVLFARRSSQAAHEAAIEARRIAEELGDPELRARTLILRARIDTDRGELALADERLRRAEALSASIEDPRVRLEARNNRAINCRRRGELPEAAAIFEEILLEYRALGDAEGETKTSINYGSVLVSLDREKEGRELFQNAHAIAHRLGQLELETQAQVWLSNLAFGAGRFEEARTGYEGAIENFRAIQNRRALGRNYFNLGQVEMILGQFERSIAHFERALEIARRSDFTDDEQRFSMELAKVTKECGFEEKARSALARAEAGASVSGAPLSLETVRAQGRGLRPVVASSANSAPLDAAEFERGLATWRADLETRGWFAIGCLLPLQPGKEQLTDATVERILPLVAELAENEAGHMAIKLLVELVRVRSDHSGVGETVHALESKIEEGPAGVGKDLYFHARSRVGSAEQRSRDLLFAEAELLKLVRGFGDPTQREQFEASRRARLGRL